MWTSQGEKWAIAKDLLRPLEWGGGSMGTLDMSDFDGD